MRKARPTPNTVRGGALDRSRGWQPHAKYRVGSLRDLHEKVVPFFRKHHLFGRKQEAFVLFAELVEMWFLKGIAMRRALRRRSCSLAASEITTGARGSKE